MLCYCYYTQFIGKLRKKGATKCLVYKSFFVDNKRKRDAQVSDGYSTTRKENKPKVLAVQLCSLKEIGHCYYILRPRLPFASHRTTL